MVVTIIAVIPALGVTVYSGLEQRRADAALAIEGALRLARLAAEEQEVLFRSTRQLLIYLAEHPEERQARPGTCSARFARLLPLYPDYVNITALTPDGHVYCSALPTRAAVNAADRDWFQRVIRTKAFTIGGYQIGRITGKPTLVAAVPVLDDDGGVRDVLAVALDLERFNRVAERAALPPDATLTVVDGVGTVLARYPDPERWVGRAFPDAPIVQAMLASPGTGHAELRGIDGVQRLFAFASLTEMRAAGDIHVSVGLPVGAAYATANRAMIRNLSVLGLVALLALTASSFGAQRLIVRPNRALLHAVRRMATGDLSVRTGVSQGAPELVELAGAFDQMADALESRQAQSDQAQSELRTSHALLNAIVEGTTDAVYIKDLEGRYRMINSAGARYVGLTPAEIMGRNDLNVLTPEQAARVREADRAVIETGETRTVETTGIFAGGERTFSVTKAPYRDAHGRIAGVIGIARDVSDLIRAGRDRERYAARLQDLSRRLLEAQEGERRRIARELHDEIGQALTAVSANLEAARRANPPPAAAERLRDGIDIVDGMIRQVRELALDLRPSLLDDLGLVAALRWHLDRVAQRAGLTAQFVALPSEMRLRGDIETLCFRVAQEALTNVVRHARARRVGVELIQQDGHLSLTVTDDGVGFDVDRAEHAAGQGESFGLLSMRERVQLAGGELEVESVPAHGTAVRAVFPLVLARRGPGRRRA
ncbi:MAG: PAS domain-containing protein [Armatimonadota bacterium]|nr:PAS domain-containing protein [Armatimonadota bacterium]